MELIRYLGKRLNKKGNLQSLGLFLCSFCFQEVERFLSNGKLAKSCGCQQYSDERSKKISKKKKGVKFTEIHKKNISESLKNKKKSEEHKQKLREKRKLQIITEEHKQKIRKA